MMENRTTYLYLVIFLTVCVCTGLYLWYNVFYDDTRTCSPPESCSIELSPHIMGTATWFLVLIIRRIAIGQNLFVRSNSISITLVEAIVGSLFTGFFSLLQEITQKTRRNSSVELGQWRGIRFRV